MAGRLEARAEIMTPEMKQLLLRTVGGDRLSVEEALEIRGNIHREMVVGSIAMLPAQEALKCGADEDMGEEPIGR